MGEYERGYEYGLMQALEICKDAAFEFEDFEDGNRALLYALNEIRIALDNLKERV